MKYVLIAAMFLVGTATASAQYRNNFGSSYGTGSNSNSHSVSPYIRSDGGYVQGHQSTNPNNTQLDNYGTRGNYNPYSGNVGTRNPRY